MNKIIKSTFKSLLMYLGYEIIPKKNGTEYLNLRFKERYIPQKIKLLNKKFEIPDAVSFYYSFHEIFTQGIYKFNSDTKKPYIVDCGANYGTSIIFFKHLYPGAEIIGFEPDPIIFDYLSKNIANHRFENVHLLNYALWNQETEIEFFSEGADAGRIRTLENSSNSMMKVKTKKLSSYISDRKVDMLKMDIEGAETEVLKEAQDHLKNVENIFIEYHSYKNKLQSLDEILSILKQNGLRYYIHTQFCPQKPLIENNLNSSTDLLLNIFGTRKYP